MISFLARWTTPSSDTAPDAFQQPRNKSMSRIAVVTPHVTTGDAVCNDVFGMHEVLTREGHDARVYAADWNGNSPVKVWSIAEIDRFLKGREDVLIYHHSMGWTTG